MRILGNILWHFPFFGFITALLAFLFGLFWTALVVTAPLGLGLIQFSKFLLAPFSYQMVTKKDLNVKQHPLWKTHSFIIMLLYLPFGLLAAFGCVIQIGLLFCSIVGIPAAMALCRGLGTFLNPVNKVCVPVAVGNAVRERKDQEQVARYLGDQQQA